MPIEDKQKKKGKRERNNLMKMFAKDSLVCQLQVAVDNIYIYMIYIIFIGKVKI